MSIKVQSLIWEHAPYRGNTLLAMLALGDWANDEGVCWPNMSTLAKKSRQSLRSVQYAIEQLAKDDFLSAEINRGAGKTNRFQINTQKLRILAEGNTQKTTEKHAKRDSAIRKNRQEPSNTNSNTKPTSSSDDDVEINSQSGLQEIPGQIAACDVQRVIQAFESSPVTTGKAKAADRAVALDLLKYFVPEEIEYGILLAGARRFATQDSRDSGVMAPVQSLAYFKNAVEEVALDQEKTFTSSYKQYLATVLRRFAKKEPQRAIG